ncbi:MAG: hypothetical protein M1838_004330 [Thelocarpon superellum]|nr:MAG: hypothetical protein M1838_004330 [Thelocarpon superellum]
MTARCRNLALLPVWTRASAALVGNHPRYIWTIENSTAVYQAGLDGLELQARDGGIWLNTTARFSCPSSPTGCEDEGPLGTTWRPDPTHGWALDVANPFGQYTYMEEESGALAFTAANTTPSTLQSNGVNQTGQTRFVDVGNLGILYVCDLGTAALDNEQTQEPSEPDQTHASRDLSTPQANIHIHNVPDQNPSYRLLDSYRVFVLAINYKSGYDADADPNLVRVPDPDSSPNSPLDSPPPDASTSSTAAFPPIPPPPAGRICVFFTIQALLASQPALNADGVPGQAVGAFVPDEYD